MNRNSKYYKEYSDYILKGKDPFDKEFKARRAVFSIIKDLTARGGLRQEFESIDADIQDQIIETWIAIVKENI